MNLFPEVKNHKYKLFTFKIIFLYLLIGFIWVVFSDSIFTERNSNPAYFEVFVHYKRFINILFTASLLYLLISKTFQQIKTQKSLNTGIDNWKFVLEGPGDGLWDWDLQSNKLTRSERWKEIFGYSNLELGTAPEDTHKLIHPEDSKKVLKDIEDFIAGKMAVLFSEFRMLCHDGSWRWVSSRGMLFSDTAGGKPTRIIGTHTDISVLKLSEDKYFQLAHYDQITQLPNRALFLDRFALDIKRCMRMGNSITLLYLDLDEFKEVNDTLGHMMGNVLLKEVGTRLTSSVRATDTVARIGGDEFVIVLNNLNKNFTAEISAQAILTKLAEPFQLGNDTAHITCTIGISTYPEDGTDIEVLLSNADQAMYAAKLLGKNRYNYFTASLQKIATERMHLVNDLRVALHRNEFQLFYQPIFNIHTGEVHKAEALIRWMHPIRGMVSPGDFIPIAESTGLIVEIGNWVFEEAVRQAVIWRKQDPNFQISINKSPVQFKLGLKHIGWIEYLRQLDLPGSSIVIEITEGLLLDAKSPVIKKLADYRDAGIQIAIDDFGTGYSSLSYLRKFEMDYLKIDQSFTSNIATSASDMALCEVIILMAHNLGMKVIAEGIETQKQLDLLLNAGCDLGQGYFFSKPVTATAFEKNIFKLN
ncbi:MAG: EAL domain-containing protein [Methylotenera sp.]|nr:EAL domain-containing protein [Methylotenera sp.]